MGNLWKSLAVMVVAYGLGHFFGGSWLAGIPTGVLGFIVAYFLLARKSMNKLTAISQEAMAVIQSGQSSQDPQQILDSLDKGMKLFEKGLELSKEQFLIAEMVHAQMGALIYQGAALHLQLKMREDMQRNKQGSLRYEKQAKQAFTEAKFHLEKAHAQEWVLTIMRQWQGVGMLAAMEFEGKQIDKALERLSKAKSLGKTDPLYWTMYAWMLDQAEKKSDAMIAANEGVTNCPGNAGLQHMADAIANQKKIDTLQFGVMWFSMFPNQLTLEVAMKLQSQAQANSPESMPQMNRQMRRAAKKQGLL